MLQATETSVEEEPTRKENKSAGNKSTLYRVCDRYLRGRKLAARHSCSVEKFSFYDARVFYSSTSMLCAFEIYLSEQVFMQCTEFLFKSKSKSYAMGMHSITNTCHKQQIQGSLFVVVVVWILNPIQNFLFFSPFLFFLFFNHPPATLHPPKHKQSSLTKKYPVCTLTSGIFPHMDLLCDTVNLRVSARPRGWQKPFREEAKKQTIKKKKAFHQRTNRKKRNLHSI